MSTNRAFVSAILVTLCLGLTHAQGGNGLCFSFNKKNGHCASCYKSKVDFTTGGCGPVLGPDNKCVIYGKIPIGKGVDLCLGCQQGYAVTTTNIAQGTNCVKDPNPIKNCFFELNVNKKKSCLACNGGAPNALKTACIPWANIKDPIAKCKVGGFKAIGEYDCFICNKGLSYSDTFGKCLTARTGPGCLEYSVDSAGNGACQACDVFNGYTMNKNLQCVKA